MAVKRIAVVGAGAAGLCAAIEAARALPGCEITVFDRMQKPAKKISVTGNGRCNFTNTDLSPANFHGDAAFLRSVLTSSFSDSETFFRSLGVLTHIEDGRVYPRSQQASAIRDSLLSAASQLKIKIITDSPVEKIEKQGKTFAVNGISADAVIIAGGGKSSSAQGSDGSAYRLLTDFGHTCTELYPALSAISSHEKFLRNVKGVRALSEIRLYNGNALLGSDFGEIQFNDGSISGIPVMNLSYLCKDLKSLRVELDLCGDLCEEELTEHIKEYMRNTPDAETETLLSGIINQKLGYAVMEKSKIAPHTLAGKLRNTDVHALVNTLKCFPLTVDKAKDFESAHITEGGIEVSQFNPKTMMSSLCDGLFACGEILNIHGKCGGYNLHLAWTTGRIAGSSAAKYITDNER